MFPVKDVFPRSELADKVAADAASSLSYEIKRPVLAKEQSDAQQSVAKPATDQLPLVFFDRSVFPHVVRWGEIQPSDQRRLTPGKLDTKLPTLLLKNGRLIAVRSSLGIIKTGVEGIEHPTIALGVEPTVQATAKSASASVVRSFTVFLANLAAGEKTSYAFKRATSPADNSETAEQIDSILVRHPQGKDQVLCYRSGNAVPMCDSQKETVTWQFSADELKFDAILAAKEPSSTTNLVQATSKDLKKLVVGDDVTMPCAPNRSGASFLDEVVDLRSKIETEVKDIEAVAKADAALLEWEDRYVVDQATYGQLLSLNSARRSQLSKRLIGLQRRVLQLQLQLEKLLLTHAACLEEKPQPSDETSSEDVPPPSPLPPDATPLPLPQVSVPAEPQPHPGAAAMKPRQNRLGEPEASRRLWIGDAETIAPPLPAATNPGSSR